MSLLSIILILCLIGLLLWAINTYLPLDPKIKTILNVVVVIFVVLFLLKAFGVLGSLSNIRL
jgi:1-acyl-sn-glycerol-3-phosphate acyltransferase